MESSLSNASYVQRHVDAFDHFGYLFSILVITVDRTFNSAVVLI